MAKLCNVFRAAFLCRACEPRREVSAAGETATVFRAVAADCHSEAWTVAGELRLLATRGVCIAIDGDTADFVVGTIERNTRALCTAAENPKAVGVLAAVWQRCGLLWSTIYRAFLTAIDSANTVLVVRIRVRRI